MMSTEVLWAVFFSDEALTLTTPATPLATPSRTSNWTSTSALSPIPSVIVPSTSTPSTVIVLNTEDSIPVTVITAVSPPG